MTATATAEKPRTNAAPASSSTAATASSTAGYAFIEPLGIKCQIFGVTGPKWSGKTLLGYQIAPGFHAEGHPYAGQSRTINLDVEMSAGTYAVPGIDRVDVPSVLRDNFGIAEYKPIDIFKWFREWIGKVPQHRYDVIMVDPASDLESGLLDYVRVNPVEFGYSAAQFSKMESVAIACAKTLWKRLLIDIAARCQLFYFTTHEKAEWKGNKPTGKMIAKGMEPLYEVASLYLRLEREKQKEGERPKPPSATILKDRLSFQEFDPASGEVKIITILPERLPEATAKAIRNYVKYPVGKRKEGIKPEELAQEVNLSDDEKLLIQAEIAANNAAAATANLSIQERMRAAAAAQAGQSSQGQGQAGQSQSAAQAVARFPQASGQVAASTTSQSTAQLDMTRLEQLKALATEAFGGCDGSNAAFADYAAAKLKEYGGLTSLRQMSSEQADDFEAGLTEAIGAKIAAAGAAESGPDAAASDVPFDTAEQQSAPVEQVASVESVALAPGPMTDQQIMVIKSVLAVVGSLAGDQAKMEAMVKPILASLGAGKIPELNAVTADAFLVKLHELVKQLEGAGGKGQTATSPQAAAATPPQAAATKQPEPGTTGPAESSDPLDQPGSIADATLRSLKEWAERTGWTKYEDHQAWLKQFRAANFRGLSERQAQGRIAELQKIADGFGGGVPGN